jgi:hypothetical protein
MPLTLRPPRKGKTPNHEIRGTYLGVRVEVSSGSHKRSVALAQLRKIEECIETHGQYPAPEPQADPGQPTFLSAAIAYMRDGGERRYVAFNLKHFRETLIKDIDQAALDAAAEKLLPTAAPDYRNRKVYTPVIAILRQALGDKCPTFKRPKGSKGVERKDFMWPEDAFAVIDEAEKDDPEFGLYLLSLLYTGIRKSEGLDALKVDTRPDDLALWLRDSKNGDPRMLKLRHDIADRFVAHLKTLPEGRERLFRFRDGGPLQTPTSARHDGRLPPSLPEAQADRLEASGLPAPLRHLPHLPSHLGDMDAHVWGRGPSRACRNQELAGPTKRSALCSRRAPRRMGPCG